MLLVGVDDESIGGNRFVVVVLVIVVAGGCGSGSVADGSSSGVGNSGGVDDGDSGSVGFSVGCGGSGGISVELFLVVGGSVGASRDGRAGGRGIVSVDVDWWAKDVGAVGDSRSVSSRC